MFKMVIRTGGAAFQCEDDEGVEINDYCQCMELKRCLEQVIDMLVERSKGGSVIDTNGNLVGNWSRE